MRATLPSDLDAALGTNVTMVPSARPSRPSTRRWLEAARCRLRVRPRCGRPGPGSAGGRRRGGGSSHALARRELQRPTPHPLVLEHDLGADTAELSGHAAADRYRCILRAESANWTISGLGSYAPRSRTASHRGEVDFDFDNMTGRRSRLRRAATSTRDGREVESIARRLEHAGSTRHDEPRRARGRDPTDAHHRDRRLRRSRRHRSDSYNTTYYVVPRRPSASALPTRRTRSTALARRRCPRRTGRAWSVGRFVMRTKQYLVVDSRSSSAMCSRRYSPTRSAARPGLDAARAHEGPAPDRRSPRCSSSTASRCGSGSDRACDRPRPRCRRSIDVVMAKDQRSRSTSPSASTATARPGRALEDDWIVAHSAQSRAIGASARAAPGFPRD